MVGSVSRRLRTRKNSSFLYHGLRVTCRVVTCSLSLGFSNTLCRKEAEAMSHLSHPPSHSACTGAPWCTAKATWRKVQTDSDKLGLHRYTRTEPQTASPRHARLA